MEGLWRFNCSYNSVVHLILRGQLPQTWTLSTHFLFIPALFFSLGLSIKFWGSNFNGGRVQNVCRSSPSTDCKAICLLLWFIMIRSHQTGDKLINCRFKWCGVLFLPFLGRGVDVCHLCGVTCYFGFLLLQVYFSSELHQLQWDHCWYQVAYLHIGPVIKLNYFYWLPLLGIRKHGICNTRLLEGNKKYLWSK